MHLLFGKVCLFCYDPTDNRARCPVWCSWQQRRSLPLIRNKGFEETWSHNDPSCLDMPDTSNDWLPPMRLGRRQALLRKSGTDVNPSDPELQRSNKDVHGMVLCRQGKFFSRATASRRSKYSRTSCILRPLVRTSDKPREMQFRWDVTSLQFHPGVRIVHLLHVSVDCRPNDIFDFLHSEACLLELFDKTGVSDGLLQRVQGGKNIPSAAC